MSLIFSRTHFCTTIHNTLFAQLAVNTTASYEKLLWERNSRFINQICPRKQIKFMTNFPLKKIWKHGVLLHKYFLTIFHSSHSLPKKQMKNLTSSCTFYILFLWKVHEVMKIWKNEKVNNGMQWKDVIKTTQKLFKCASSDEIHSFQLFSWIMMQTILFNSNSVFCCY